MGTLLVYLAGKIRKNGWRKIIVPNIRNVAGDVDDIITADPTPTVIHGLYMTGPYFIGCDHGCFHGEGSHGVGSNEMSRCGAGVPSEIVPTVCMRQIRDSNFVFAFIDDASCYGTLCEIGYAIGIGRPVAVMFSSDELEADMWFVAESANILFNTHGALKKSNIKEAHFYLAAQNIADLLAEGAV